jgi:hypothetical protein
LASPGAATLVANNTIRAYHRGIFHNLQYQNASNATIADNSIFVETNGSFSASTRVKCGLSSPMWASTSSTNVSSSRKSSASRGSR